MTCKTFNEKNKYVMKPTLFSSTDFRYDGLPPPRKLVPLNPFSGFEALNE